MIDISEENMIYDCCTDYIDIMEAYIDDMEQCMSNIVQEQCWSEVLTFLSLQKVIEANGEVDDVDRKNGLFINRIGKFFVHIKNLIKRIIAKFTDKVNSLLGRNDNWFNENAHLFEKISDKSLDKLKVTMIPYWDAEDRLYEPINKVVTKKIDGNENTLAQENLSDENALYRWAAPKLYAIDRKDSSAAAKEYYRGTNKLTEVQGKDNMRNLIDRMIKYCTNYKKLSQSLEADGEAYNKMVDSYNKKIRRETENWRSYEDVQRKAQKEEDKKTQEEERKVRQKESKNRNNATNESSIAEIFNNNYAFLLEADNNNRVDTSAKVTAEKDTDERFNAKKTQYNTTMRKYNNIMKLLSLMQRVYAAKLTIAEESYVKYLSVLKSIKASADFPDKGQGKEQQVAQTEERKAKNKKKSLFGRFFG